MKAEARVSGAPESDDAAGDLRRSVAELRAEIADALDAARRAAATRAEALSGEIVDGLDEAARRGRASREAFESTVRTHPMAAIGIAAGLGLLFGLALRR